MLRKLSLYLSLFIIILLFVFRNLFFNLSSNLLDWRDYPFYIWQMFQNVTHISNLDLLNLFETNAFNPHKLTLLFLDTMLPQSLIFMPFLTVTKNMILSLNLTFIATMILNFISLFIFWKKIFKREIIAFFGSIFFIFSPFFYAEVGHFPMMSYWPFFFGLYFLFKTQGNNSTRQFVTVGIFLFIQFLASVYLSVFMLSSILIFFFVIYIFKPVNISLKQIISALFIILLIFLALGGVFIKGYLDVKHMYNARRDFRDFVVNSAHLSDYLFTSEVDSLIHQSAIMKTWNKFDLNKGLGTAFPGFLLSTFALFSLLKISKDKEQITIKLTFNEERTFFFILIIVGILFSLGPKLNFNGFHTDINLPYNLLIKSTSLSEVIRAPIRWAFIFYLGLIYFSLITLNKIAGKIHYKFFLLLIFIIFAAEYIPLHIETSQKTFITEAHHVLKSICSKEKNVLLELPLTHFDVYPNIIEGLEYITTKVQLASTFHQCNLVNGYSGYDLPDNFVLSGIVNKYIQNQDSEGFVKELRERNINLVKFNKNYFAKELEPLIDLFIDGIATQSGVKRIDNYIYKVL